MSRSFPGTPRLVVALTFMCAVPAMPRGARADTLVVGRDGATLQETLDRASDGDVVEVPTGTWSGPARVERRVTLRGTGGVIDGGGHGTTVVVAAAGAVVEGLTVRGSGSNLSAPDCCIYVTPEATGAVIRDNDLPDCAFGIWIHQTDQARIEDNRVEGREGVRSPDRGNGIQLFDAQHLIVRGNRVIHARDGIYVSATENSLIADNVTEEERFGVHYMYAHRNTVRGNVSRHNLVGLALMESSHLVVTDNRAEDNERDGILFRDAEYCEIRNNTLLRNGQGMFFFSSTENVIDRNLLMHNDIGMKVWAGSLRNEVSRNAFIGNRTQVFFVGSEDLVWGDGTTGNYWSDYLGWDQDGDGLGDRPYRVDSFTASLVYRQPAAALLLRSPALELLSHLAGRMPVLRTATIIDRSPVIDRDAAGPAPEDEP